MDSQNDQINNSLCFLYDWLCVNKLSLNTEKTKYMVFHYYQKKIIDKHLPLVKINNELICKVDNFKFLGIYIDSTLSWKNHINYISNKIARINGILSMLKYYLPTKILLILYNSLILSHLNYGINLWGFGNYSRLSTLQKQALRHVNKSPYNSHSSPIAKKYKTLFISDIFNISCLKFYYKFKNNLLPLYFYNPPFLQLNKPTRHSCRQTKLPSNLNNFIVCLPIIQPFIPIPTSNKISSTKCLRFEIPKLLSSNYLPSNIINRIETHSLKSPLYFLSTSCISCTSGLFNKKQDKILIHKTTTYNFIIKRD